MGDEKQDRAISQWRTLARPLSAVIGLGVASWAGWALWRRGRLADLRGQVVLITGGSRGLGLELARVFARHGARLALCARDEAELDRARAELEQRGAEVFAVAADLTQPGAAHRLVEQVTARYGRVDILVNNAGVIIVGPVAAQTREDFAEALDSMFWGLYDTTSAVLPQMRARQSGRIVNVTSIGGKISVPHLLPYSTAKFAAVAFSEGLRAELAREGIHVITVCPGLMRTGSPPNALFKGQHAREYTLFTLLDSLPGVSMSAARAARQIVRAARAGRAELVVGAQARLAVALHGLFPGLTANVLGLVNQFLPTAGDAPDAQARQPGAASETPITRSPLTLLTRRAAQRNNELAAR